MNSKLFSKSLLIIVFSILLNNYVFGQTYDVVVILNDNSTVKGELLELTTDSVAVIEEGTGKYLVLKGSEISTVYIKGLNESIKFPISEVPDIFDKDSKEKTAVPYIPGAVYIPSETYTPITRSTLYSIGISYGGVSGKSEEAVDGFKETEFVGGTVISGSFLFLTSNGGSFGLGIESYSMELEESFEDLGTLNLIPIMLLIQWYKIPYGVGLGAHVGVGLGINLASFDNGLLLTSIEQETGVNITVDTESAFVFELSGGLDYFFSENISISIDGRYIIGSVGTSLTISAGSISEQLDDFDSFSITNFQYLAGLRFWFK